MNLLGEVTANSVKTPELKIRILTPTKNNVPLSPNRSMSDVRPYRSMYNFLHMQGGGDSLAIAPAGSVLGVPVGLGGKMVGGADGDALGESEIVGEIDAVGVSLAVFVVEGEAPTDNVAVGVVVVEGRGSELKLMVGDAVVPIVEVGVVEDPTVDEGVLVVLMDGVDDAVVPTVAVVVDVTDTVGVTDGEVESVGSTVAEPLELNVGVLDIDPVLVAVGVVDIDPEIDGAGVGVAVAVDDRAGDGSAWRAMNGMNASSACVSSSNDFSNTSTKVKDFLSLAVLFLRNMEETLLRRELFTFLKAEEALSKARVSSTSSKGMEKKCFKLSN